MPKSLDDTYLRVLRQIPQANQVHAHRMMQCLVVAVRPLKVEELAELLAFEFDGSEGGIPKYRSTLRLDDQTQAVLSTCSSLVTIIDNGPWYGQVVQFSHFSVKEFLLSNRLTISLGDVCQFRIHHGSAHTTLTQACLGVLLDLYDDVREGNVESGSSLTFYAAKHWVEHAQFEDVASRVKDGIQSLFDPDKHHLKDCAGIYTLDQGPLPWWFISEDPNPFYYAVLCGFYDVVEHLAIKHPQYVNAFCGRYGCPLLAALSQGYVEIAELLLEHGADVDARKSTGETILLIAILWLEYDNHLCNVVKNVVEFLLTHGADVNFQDDDGKTPLHSLLEIDGRHKARRDDDEDYSNHVRLLLKHGAEVNRRDNDNETLLHLAILWKQFNLAGILLEHGADANAENNRVMTPLHLLSESDSKDEGNILNLMQLLLKHGAEVNRRDKDNETPLNLAIRWNHTKLVRILLEHGADSNAENDEGQTSLHVLSETDIEDESHILNLVLLLLKHGAEVNRLDNENDTPLNLAIQRKQFNFAGILLEHGADANAENRFDMTPLHSLSESNSRDESNILNLMQLLLKHGSEVNRKGCAYETPLNLAIRWNHTKLVRILLEHGADPNAENLYGQTSLHILSESDIKDEKDEADFLTLALLLSGHGAVVNGRDQNNQTPLHLAILRNRFELAGILLEHGADTDAENNHGKTPLRTLMENWSYDKGDLVDHVDVQPLVHGIGMNRQQEDNKILLLPVIGEKKQSSLKLLLSLATQILLWRTTSPISWHNKYHGGTTTLGNAVLGLCYKHLNTAWISKRKMRTKLHQHIIYSMIWAHSRLPCFCSTIQTTT